MEHEQHHHQSTWEVLHQQQKHRYYLRAESAATFGNGIYLAPSLMEGAGFGLFAGRRFGKKDLITEFDGRFVAKEVGDAMKAHGLASHVITLGYSCGGLEGLRIPAFGRGGGSFVNNLKGVSCGWIDVADAAIKTGKVSRQYGQHPGRLKVLGDDEPTSFSGLAATKAKVSVNTKDAEASVYLQRKYLVAQRNIEKGEELTVDYGPSYHMSEHKEGTRLRHEQAASAATTTTMIASPDSETDEEDTVRIARVRTVQFRGMVRVDNRWVCKGRETPVYIQASRASLVGRTDSMRKQLFQHICDAIYTEITVPEVHALWQANKASTRYNRGNNTASAVLIFNVTAGRQFTLKEGLTLDTCDSVIHYTNTANEKRLSVEAQLRRELTRQEDKRKREEVARDKAQREKQQTKRARPRRRITAQPKTQIKQTARDQRATRRQAAVSDA